MNEKVAAFLAKQEESEAEKRKKLLIENGLYEKRYPDSTMRSPMGEYTFYDDYDHGYYAKDPIEITDEEFEKIQPYLVEKKSNAKKTGDAMVSTFNSDDTPYQNSIAIFLKVVAILIYVVGGIGGLIAGSIFKGSGNVIGISVTWISAFITGSMFLGLSEIINKLDSANDAQDETNSLLRKLISAMREKD